MKIKLEQLWEVGSTRSHRFPRFQSAKPRQCPAYFWRPRTDVTQTFFDIGHLGGEFRDTDYPALEVAAQILGGGFSSRLLQRIRTKQGWAYNIWSVPGMRTTIIPASSGFPGSTQSVHTVDTLRAVREELEKFQTSEVTDEELKTAKDTVLNGFVFHFDRPSKTLNRLVLYEYFGYPRDFLFQYQKAMPQSVRLTFCAWRRNI